MSCQRAAWLKRHLFYYGRTEPEPPPGVTNVCHLCVRLKIFHLGGDYTVNAFAWRLGDAGANCSKRLVACLAMAVPLGLPTSAPAQRPSLTQSLERSNALMTR